MSIKDWSITPGNNNAVPPNGWPEGMQPSAVNDTARQQMADHRAQWNDAQWFVYGDGDGAASIAYATANSFTVAASNVTATYHAGRRVKAVGAITGTIYGTISSSSFSINTTVGVVWDSGSLSNEALTISLSINPALNTGLPTSVGSRDFWGGLSTGAANIYTITINPKPPSIADGLRVGFRAHQASTSSATLTVNGVSAPLTMNGQALTGGEIKLGVNYQAVYNGTASRWEVQAAVVAGVGDVFGPVSSVNNGVALFNGTSGKVIKDGGALGTAAFLNVGTGNGNIVQLGATGLPPLNNDNVPATNLILVQK